MATSERAKKAGGRRGREGIADGDSSTAGRAGGGSDTEREAGGVDAPQLSVRHQRFADLVLQGRPAGRAYEEAGFDARGDVADASASRLLGTEKVAAYIATHRDRATEHAELSVEWVLRRLRENAECGTPRDENKALELLGKHLGCFQADRTNDADKLSTEDLLAKLPDALRALGVKG